MQKLNKYLQFKQHNSPLWGTFYPTLMMMTAINSLLQKLTHHIQYVPHPMQPYKNWPIKIGQRHIQLTQTCIQVCCLETFFHFLYEGLMCNCPDCTSCRTHNPIIVSPKVSSLLSLTNNHSMIERIRNGPQHLAKNVFYYKTKSRYYYSDNKKENNKVNTQR